MGEQAGQEMTLDEYVGVLHRSHRAVNELATLRTQLAALTAERDELLHRFKHYSATMEAERSALTAEAEKLRADAEAAKEREGQLRRALEGTYELANSITIYPYDKQDRILRQARKALAGEGAS